MSELIAKTRELGALIQQSDEFAAVQTAMESNTQDEELVALMRNLQMAEGGYASESHSENPSESKMQAYKDEFERLYALTMQRPAMQQYQAAHHALGELMNKVFGILTLCADGEDPATAEPPEEHQHCGGDCGGSCSGCG
ncbi:MAG: YlbF family regulator [Oscillospiraceae bacterium]|nr:YlbF family regulator [Oscillospiraceae bacterium]